jgi:hypothetical protein
VGGLAPSDTGDEGSLCYTENLIAEKDCIRTHAPRTLLAAPGGGDGLSVIHTEDGEQLCYTAGRDLMVGAQRYAMELTDVPHRLIPFGDMLLIFPERRYLRLSDGECGSLDALLTTESATLFTPCRADGSPYLALTVSATAPTSPAHGDHWLDTAFKPILLRCYNAAREEWQTVTDTYLRLSSDGIGRSFRVGDTVRLSNVIPAELKHLEGNHRLIACGKDHLVISAPPCVTLRQVAPLSVSRRMPDVDPDTLLLWRDRLIGAARTADEHGNTVTMLCACRAGDPFNWQNADGEPDTALSRRMTGIAPITASAVYNGAPHFFTEQSVLRLSGESASAQWHLTPLTGVMSGCGETLCAVGGVLYYRSRYGMMCYDGKRVTPLPSLPWRTAPRAAAAGVLGDRYYLSMTDESGKAEMLIYHTADRLWSRLDHTRATRFVPYQDVLCYRDGCDGAVRILGDIAQDTDVSDVRWLAETNPICVRDGDGGQLLRLELTLVLAEGGEAQILTEGEDGRRSSPIEICGRGQTLIRVPIHPHAAEQFKLEIRGRGAVRLMELARITR